MPHAPDDGGASKVASVLVGVCLGSVVAILVSTALRRFMGVQAGLQGTVYDGCRRLLIFLIMVFGSMCFGVVFGWNVIVTQGQAGNALTWSLTFAIGWSALGIMLGSILVRFWHLLYICLFLANFFTWPIVMRFTIASPKAENNWHSKYDPFPLNSASYLRNYPLGDQTNSIWMSPVPDSPQSCNYSCGNSDVERNAASMNFPVRISINNQSLASLAHAHVLYPVLLMSADFENWWVAADHRESKPSTFFRSISAQTAFSYQVVVPETKTLLETTTTTTFTSVRRLTGMSRKLIDQDNQVLRPNQGMYILACVVTNETKLRDHQQQIIANDNAVYETSYLETYCDAVGGSCGYPCGQFSQQQTLPKCTAEGAIDTKHIKANQGKATVGIKACLGSSARDSPTHCTTSTLPMSDWACPSVGFPAMQVIAHNVVSNTDSTAIRPNTFMFVTNASSFGTGTGKWHRYNRFSILNQTVDPSTSYVGHQMTAVQDNVINIQPDKCYGKPGPLYMVACAVNASNYASFSHAKWKGHFKIGQSVAPPPFNDRCVAVSGQCGLACQERDADTLVGPYCSPDGKIKPELLVGPLKLQRNDSWLIKYMVFVLILGYFQRVLSAIPGLFSIFPQARKYIHEMTDDYKYIAVATPSAGEDKMCVLRNLVGTTSAYPAGCLCKYHVVFLDEGHRHDYKGLFLAYVDAVHAVLQHAASIGDEDKYERFMELWVKTTRALRMDDETDKYYRVRRAATWNEADMKESQVKADAELVDKVCGYIAWKEVFKGVEPPAPFRLLKAEVLEVRKGHTIMAQMPEMQKVDVIKDDVQDLTFNYYDPESKGCRPNLCFHYIARAKMQKDDEQVLDTQHVTVGMPYYELSLAAGADWMKTRELSKVMQAHRDPGSNDCFRVPMTTSRGKAGGLNFAANYLYKWHLKFEPADQWDPELKTEEPQFKPGLFSIADARHQYQPSFMESCIPYFFKEPENDISIPERDPEVAFTQVPQFFPEMHDESDFLDNNNAMYFRINGTIRNCCGGASSCGANGTWQLGDPRDDDKKYGLCKEYYVSSRKYPEGWQKEWAEGYIWEIEPNPHVDTQEEMMLQLGPKKSLKERTIFHESCKIEDTASSLNAVLRGQRSQYVNMRLSYAMTKAPVNYLAAVQRWAEGAVVLMLQTYVDMPLHTKNPGLSKLANYLVLLALPAFIAWTCAYVYGSSHDPWALLMNYTGDNSLLITVRDHVFGAPGVRGLLEDFGMFGLVRDLAPTFQQHVTQLFLMAISIFTWWTFGIICFIFGIYMLPTCVYGCCRRCRRSQSTPVWPHEMSAWARLAIIMDNLTYWLFFHTAFFWVFFNAYTAYFDFVVSFSSKYFYLILIVATSVFHYSQMIVSMIRATNIQRDEGNAVLSISLDNIWRQTQLYYINAPLQLYAIVAGVQDYFKQKSYGVDLSFWVGGDRGAFTTQIVKFWLSTMILIALLAVPWQFLRSDPNMTSVIATIILLLTAMDVAFPCVYLSFGTCPSSYKQAVKEYKQKQQEAVEDEQEEKDGPKPGVDGKAKSSSCADSCCSLCTRCLRCGESRTEMPVLMRLLTPSWYGSILYRVFCESSCVVGFLKYVGVIKEFLVPVGVGLAIFAQGSASTGGDGSAALLQLVAAGFAGAH
jgi:hypothetical protein